MPWKDELKSAVRSETELRSRLSLTEGEAAWFDSGAKHKLPFAVTSYYLSLIGQDPADPLRRMAVPDVRELSARPGESDDPLAETSYSPLGRLVHRYPDRALLLVTDACAGYCRHCFRRRFTGGAAASGRMRGALKPAELAAVLDYLRLHPEIGELILSGGDPLTLSDARLGRLLDAFRGLDEGRSRPLLLRLGSRIPATLPSRITPALVRRLRRAAPLWMAVQFNHPRELTAEAERALGLLVDSGLPVLNQAVLLRGVNDDPAVLAELCQGLARLRVKPYYLFQGDLATGTAHLRVNLVRAIAIHDELRRRVSGLALPAFAFDLPGGGGKVTLGSAQLVRATPEILTLRTADGTECDYPNESETKK